MELRRLGVQQRIMETLTVGEGLVNRQEYIQHRIMETSTIVVFQKTVYFEYTLSQGHGNLSLERPHVLLEHGNYKKTETLIYHMNNNNRSAIWTISETYVLPGCDYVVPQNCCC